MQDINQKNCSQAIFFGNGLNRLHGGIDWDKLLQEVSKANKKSNIKTNTMLYESIYLDKDILPVGISTPFQKTTEYCLKKDIANKLEKQQKTNKIYKRLVNLPVTEYITTNYDHSLELALCEEGFEKDENCDTSENKYSIHRYRQYHKGNEKKRIWYIHGDIDKPVSIMLGYDHYCGCLSKIVGYIKGTYTNKVASNKVRAINKRLEEYPFEIVSWIDLFFTHDIHFVGYGLDFAEIDIWWLLTKRTRMMREHKINLKNDIIYHCCDENPELDDTLKAFGVTRSYDEIAAKLEKNEKYEPHYCNVLNKL